MEITNTYRKELDNGYAFTFTPATGRVEINSSHWIAKTDTAIHLASKGWELDYNHRNNNFGDKGKTIYVKIPDISEEALQELIDITVSDAENLTKKQAKKEKQELLAQNWNNREDKPLSWESINAMLSTIKKDKKYDRQYLSDYVNSFNFEEAESREKAPLLKVSTTPKPAMVESARKGLKSLYEKGKLVRYTEEEVKQKLAKYEEQ